MLNTTTSLNSTVHHANGNGFGDTQMSMQTDEAIIVPEPGVGGGMNDTHRSQHNSMANTMRSTQKSDNSIDHFPMGLGGMNDMPIGLGGMNDMPMDFDAGNMDMPQMT